MQFEISMDIAAAPEAVWGVLTDVERWPQWTASTSVQRLDDGAFTVGSATRVKQPRLPAMVWRVTELDQPRCFAWTATSGGVTTVADHRLRPNGGGGTTVTLSIAQTGLLAPLVGLLTSSLTRRYVAMEARGLKRRCEER